MVLMFLSYAVALRAAKYLSRRAVLVSIAALNALVLVAPPLLSTDLFSYIAYGRLGGTYGINPYLYGPNVISFDPLYHLVGAAVDPHAHRLRAAVHRAQLSAGRA